MEEALGDWGWGAGRLFLFGFWLQDGAASGPPLDGVLSTDCLSSRQQSILLSRVWLSILAALVFGHLPDQDEQSDEGHQECKEEENLYQVSRIRDGGDECALVP